MSKEYEYLKKFDSDINRYRKDADMIKKLEKVKKLQFEYDDFEVFDTLISNGKYFPNLETFQNIDLNCLRGVALPTLTHYNHSLVMSSLKSHPFVTQRKETNE